MPILPIDAGRYGSREMRDLFDEDKSLRYKLDVEAAVADAQSSINIIPTIASKEISSIVQKGIINLERVKDLERVSDHDIAAIVEALSEQCSESTKPWIHFGLTSNDLIDTSTSLQLKDAFTVIKNKIYHIACSLAQKAAIYKSIPAVGRTHGQHASIISFGLKFAVWAEEMLRHLDRITESEKRVLLCKTLGVVGTGSFMGEHALQIQDIVANRLGLYSINAATQVIPRERHAEFIFILSIIASTLDKIAIEIRNLQRTEIKEVEEPFKIGQIGSSAVPVKRNPIKSERVSSLARLMRSFVQVSLENIPLWHERDLSNSANERFTIPMSCILLDEMLDCMIKVIDGLKVNTERILSNLDITRGQIYAEFLLEYMVKKGISRFEAYRDIQKAAFNALENNQDFIITLQNDEKIIDKIKDTELITIFNPKTHLASSQKIIENIIDSVETYYKKR